jgi:hypothetical protein
VIEWRLPSRVEGSRFPLAAAAIFAAMALVEAGSGVAMVLQIAEHRGLSFAEVLGQIGAFSSQQVDVTRVYAGQDVLDWVQSSRIGSNLERATWQLAIAGLAFYLWRMGKALSSKLPP